ncbi:MAG: Cobalt-zinc-cadmium resistance protein CzcC [Chlamydiales bacterium]|nr:Cobalt-zinc-cadmium resistance protein CzcC [Chlamydiales bacterium]
MPGCPYVRNRTSRDCDVPVKWLLILAWVMSGCARMSLSPLPEFAQLQEEVLCRTGETISWDTDASFHNCIATLLEDPLTLQSAVYIALINNRSLQAMYEELGMAKAHLVQAGLLTNPIFALSYRFSTRPTVTDLIDLSLFQNALETLLIPLKKRAATKELEAAKWRVATEILEVIAHTTSTFYTLQAEQQLWELKQQEVLALECSYEAAQRLFEAGNIKEVAVTEKQTAYAQAKIEAAALEGEILATKESLNQLMGLWGMQICWQADSSLPPVTNYQWGDVETSAIANSLDLQIARQTLCATAASIGIDTARIVFPAMEIGPSAEREDQIWYVGPAFALALPLFDFGQANAAAGQAALYNQWNAYTALAVDIRSAARAARIALLNAARQWRYAHSTVIPLTEKTFTLTLLQHNAMQMGVFELLAAKRNEILAQMEAVRLQKEYWVAHTTLDILLKGHRVMR